MERLHSRAVLALLFLCPPSAMADMEDGGQLREPPAVVVTDFQSSGVDLGSKNRGDTLFRIAGVVLNITGDGTRCGKTIHSVEVEDENHVTRIDLNVPKVPVSSCQLHERTMKVMLPLMIADNGAGGKVKRLIKLHFRKFDEQGERLDTLRVLKVDYVKVGDKQASVHISDPYRH